MKRFLMAAILCTASVSWGEDAGVTTASNWSYRYDDEYKSTKELLDLLIGVVAKGGCLVLNVAPRPDGEAIYGTRPVAPYMKRNWAFTQKNGVVYAIRKTNSGERNVQQVVLPPETTAGEIAKVVHLSSGRECPFVKTPDGWRVKLPAGVTYDLNADAFRLEFVR